MTFNQLALSFIGERINHHPAPKQILGQIIQAGKRGKIAFYPCSRCANTLLKQLQQASPETMAQVAGVFDNSPSAFAEADVTVYSTAELARFQPSLAAVVVATNVFHGRERATVEALTNGRTPIIAISGIDLELAEADRGQLVAQIGEVVGLLADEKSRTVYLLAWLARLLNDENLTQLFEGDRNTSLPSEDGTVLYKTYRLDFLPPDIVNELGADVYSLKEVSAQKGDTVLDVGAFKGDTAVYFADLVGPSGKVFSFEPVRANYQDLVHNIRQNALEKIIHPVNKGCGATAGRYTIATAPHGSPWAFVSADRGIEEIDVTTVDEFVAAEKLDKVDFVKLDVEGVEEEVLMGAATTIAGLRPKMAVSLYHNLVDLTRLPLLLNSMASYNLYIRCKTAGPWSIFLYCEPKA